MIAADKILDYDKLVETYSANLDITLRGFRPAEETLDTWVPDDDTLRSLSSLVEAAQLGGSDSVAVRVSNKTLEAVNLDTLKEKLGTFGEVRSEQEGSATVFSISALQETASFRSVRPIYQQRLRARLGNMRFKRALQTDGNQIPLRATKEGFALALSIRTDTHIIADAVFEATSRRPMQAALDVLCEILVGLPIQEARDHAIIRLEFALRDPEQTHPISGIILPRNADPIFRVPSLLLNRLFDDYITSTQYQPKMNFFDPGPKAAWAALPHEEREKCVTTAINSHGPAIGIAADEVHVVECKRPYAVTIQFNGNLSIPAKRSAALKLERLVRKECDPRLEVFCEEKKDLSKLRRQIEHVDKEKADS
jgi:NifU-like protein involved in Fe-S cluster formation